MSYYYSQWVADLQRECNRQGFSNQVVDGIAGPITLAGCPMVRIWARGNITRLIQGRLTRLGFDTQGIDGIFGPNTFAAVKAYQTAKGILVDGIVGQQTWSKLLKLS